MFTFNQASFITILAVMQIVFTLLIFKCTITSSTNYNTKKSREAVHEAIQFVKSIY